MSTATTAVRVLDGVEIPAAGTWEIDPSHSNVGFIVRHLVVSKVRGQFATFAGAITVGQTPEQSSVSVTIDAASVNTRDERRDGHLRSPDFFDVEKHPEWTFDSTGFVQTGPASFDLPGNLTIHGITKPVTLKATFDGLVGDPWGGTRAAFTATTEIDREAFDLTWNQALEAGGVMVGKTVKIELEIQAVLKA